MPVLNEVIVSDVPLDDMEQDVFNEETDSLEEPEDTEEDETEGDETDDDETDESEDGEESDDDEEDDSEDEDDEDADDDSEGDDDEPAATSTGQAEADAAAQMLSQHDIDYNGLVDEYLNGGLKEDSLKKLEEAGYPKAVIESYIAGQQAKYNVYANNVVAAAGGDKEYTSLCQWAAKNLSQEERDEFDAAVESMNPGKAKFAVKALKAMRESAVGKAPKLISGKTSTGTKSVKPFNSPDEIAAAMDDPRYETDPKYTKQVEARLMATN